MPKNSSPKSTESGTDAGKQTCSGEQQEDKQKGGSPVHLVSSVFLLSDLGSFLFTICPIAACVL